MMNPLSMWQLMLALRQMFFGRIDAPEVIGRVDVPDVLSRVSRGCQ